VQVVNCGLEKESSVCMLVGQLWYVMCARIILSGEKQLQIMKGFRHSGAAEECIQMHFMREHRYQIMVPLRRRLRGVSVT
jgi:hypothetical protein